MEVTVTIGTIVAEVLSLWANEASKTAASEITKELVRKLTSQITKHFGTSAAERPYSLVDKVNGLPPDEQERLKDVA